jgi:hypothetical protein
MVEQRPFKALVVGSSPTQPRVFNLALKLRQAAVEAIRQAVEHNPLTKFIPLVCCYLLLFFWFTLADLTFLPLIGVHLGALNRDRSDVIPPQSRTDNYAAAALRAFGGRLWILPKAT